MAVTRPGWRFPALFGLAIWSAAPARGQEPTPLGRVTGHVVSSVTEQPIPGATVRLVGGSQGSRTDRDGHFLLTDVAPGVYGLEVRAIGFTPFVAADLVVGTAKPYQVEVRLSPTPVTLEGVEVQPSYFRDSEQAATSTRTLDGEDTRRAPGANEDVVRAVALLPGVAVTSPGRNDLIVRGGAPYENLFVVDGIEIPNINHFGSQGSTGGPLSLLNIEFIQATDFSAGGFGARWGDRTASLTNIVLREGNDERLSGEVNLSATGFGAIAEGPLGPRGSFLLGARRSYLDLLFRAAGFSFVPSYWDFQLKTTQRVGANNIVSLLAIGALDRVSFFDDDAEARFENSRILAPEQQQYFTGVRWRHFLPRGTLAVTLGRTYRRFHSVQRDSLAPPRDVFRADSDEGENSLRADLVLEPSWRVELTVGGVARYASDLSYDVALSGSQRLDASGQPSPLAVDTSFTAFRAAAYAQVRYAVSPAVRLSAGLRATYYGFLGRAVRVAPRLGLRLALDRATTITWSVGRYHQAPSYVWLLGDPGNPRSLTPIRSDQLVVGIERQVRPDTKLQLEGYVKRYRDYPARVFRPQAVLSPAGFEDVTTEIPFGLEPLASAAEGRAYGLELFLQKKLSATPLYGLASLAVSRSEFTAIDGVTRPGAYDGRFIGTLLLGYRLNPRWEVGGKFRLASGLPTTPFLTTGPDAGRLDFTRYHTGPRLPWFHALDIRVDRRWSFRRVQLEVYLDVENLYGRKNVSAFRWNARDGAPEADTSLGVLPTVGVNLEF